MIRIARERFTSTQGACRIESNHGFQSLPPAASSLNIVACASQPTSLRVGIVIIESKGDLS
jgi:hypothetical protein